MFATTIGPALLAACIVAEIGLQLCFKRAALPVVVHAERARWAGIVRVLPLSAGLGLWAIELPLWIATLQHMPLAIAYPAMALTFAGVPLAARLLLRERLGRGQYAGIALVVAGVACVGATGLAA